MISRYFRQGFRHRLSDKVYSFGHSCWFRSYLQGVLAASTNQTVVCGVCHIVRPILVPELSWEYVDVPYRGRAQIGTGEDQSQTRDILIS